jgi:hypothetical protein
MFCVLRPSRHLSFAAALCALLLVGARASAQEGGNVAPAAPPAQGQPDSQTSTSRILNTPPTQDDVPPSGQPREQTTTTATQVAPAGMAHPSPDSLVTLRKAQAAPNTTSALRGEADVQAVDKANPDQVSRQAQPRSGAHQSGRKKAAQRPASRKPIEPPPVVGGVYYPPSSPVYEANGYTWGYQPGRYTPGRYTPGRYTPGRYTPGRYTPPGQAATAVLQAEEQAAESRRPTARKQADKAGRMVRVQLPTHPTDPNDRPAGRWDDQQGATRIYGEMPPLPGNGAIVGPRGYGYYSAPIIIQPPPRHPKSRAERYERWR